MKISAVVATLGGLLLGTVGPLPVAAQSGPVTASAAIPYCVWGCTFLWHRETGHQIGAGCEYVPDPAPGRQVGTYCIASHYDCELYHVCTGGGFALLDATGEVLAAGEGCITKGIVVALQSAITRRAALGTEGKPVQPMIAVWS